MDIVALYRRFNLACQANENRITEIHGGHGLNPLLPVRIHHYTNIEGLHGVLSSRELWATNVEYLNDSAEISYGLNLATQAVERQIEQHVGDTNLPIRDQLRRILYKLNHHRSTTSYFVTCFCEVPDLLSQWRAYGKNAGYSLDLDASKFYASISNLGEGPPPAGSSPPSRPTYMERVVYDPAAQQSLMAAVIQSCVDAYRDLMGDEDFISEEKNTLMDKDFEELSDRFATYAAGKALRFVSQFKHPAFEEEKEWRLVHRRDAADYASVQFRTGYGCLIPYVASRFDPNECLESITCGPPALPLSMNSIRTFIRATGLNDLPVFPTKAPLRL